MKLNQQKFILRASVLAFFGIGALVGLYFAFRFTLIADLREAIINPDTTNLVVYGETLFQTRGCTGCHAMASANASGDVGPNLTGIANRHDSAYIRESIINPNAVIAPQCPEGACESGVMPQFGSILDAAQIDALVAYLMQQQ